MASDLVRKSLAIMAHTTTTLAFGTAIVGLMFPQKAANYVATFMDDVQHVRSTLDGIETTSAATATATTTMVDRMAERPRFHAESHLIRPGGVFGDGAEIHQFQMGLENLTDRSITELVIIVTGVDGQMTSNLLANAIPPYESHIEITMGLPDVVCYAYKWDGEFYSETRKIEVSAAPVIDQMGNASTYGFNHFDYVSVDEPDSDAFSCGDAVYTRTALAARQAELDAAAQ